MNHIIGITERGDAALDLTWKTWVEKNKPAILLTKAPNKLAETLLTLNNMNIIIHCTITGYGDSILEPFVKPYQEEITSLKALKKLLPSERIVLRIDPIIPTENGIKKAIKIINEAQKIGLFRIRISFLDLYDHVKKRFKTEEIPLPWETFHAPLEIRQQALKTIQETSKTIVEICSEPDFKCTGCISEFDCTILKVEPKPINNTQRKLCMCMSSKKELLKNKTPCQHKCLYCYWKSNGE
jgi:DNA repair photolyase